jgi:uncharacterized protein YxjI
MNKIYQINDGTTYINTPGKKWTILSTRNEIYQINDGATYINSPGKIVRKLFLFNSNNDINLNFKRHFF